MAFFSKAIQQSDWVMDNVTGTYSYSLPQSVHGQIAPIVVTLFESSLSQGLKCVVGETDVTPNGDCTITFNMAIDGRIVVRGD